MPHSSNTNRRENTSRPAANDFVGIGSHFQDIYGEHAQRIRTAHIETHHHVNANSRESQSANSSNARNSSRDQGGASSSRNPGYPQQLNDSRNQDFYRPSDGSHNRDYHRQSNGSRSQDDHRQSSGRRHYSGGIAAGGSSSQESNQQRMHGSYLALLQHNGMRPVLDVSSTTLTATETLRDTITQREHGESSARATDGSVRR